MAHDSSGNAQAIDQELLRAVREAPEGDLRAFEELVRRYQNRILANCRYLTGDKNNAEDLSQEVFLKAFLVCRNSKVDLRSDMGSIGLK